MLHVLNNRLLAWAEESNVLNDEQNGFRKLRSCIDHMYVLYTTVKNRLLHNKDTFACFIDAKKAFDKVDRDCMWYKLHDIGVKGKMFNAIKSLYTDVTCKVRVNGQCTESFPVNCGAKQGCNLSPTLFAFYINDLALDIKNLNVGITAGKLNLSLLLYADDIVLLAGTAGDLQLQLNVLNRWCHKWRMTINQTKSKVIHFRCKTTKQTVLNFKCGDIGLDITSEYKYLGLWFNEFLDLQGTVKHIAKSATRALGAVISKFKRTGGILFDCYKQLFDNMVKPVLLYGAGIWRTENRQVIITAQNNLYLFIPVRN